MFFVCTCNIFSDITKTTTSGSFFYDSNFSQNRVSECCCAIIYNISHAKSFVLEKIYRKTKNTPNNVLKIVLK